MVETAVGLLLDVDIGHACVLLMGFFQTVKVETGIVADISFDDLRAEEVTVVGRVIAEKKLSLTAFVHNDEHTAVDHQIHIRAQDVHHLYGTVHFDVLRHIDKESVLCQHRVQRRHRVLFGLGNLTIVLRYQVGMVVCCVAKTLQDDALGQLCLRQRFLVELVIDDKIERSAEVGHIAMEDIIRVDRDVDAVDVQSIVGRKELLHVGVLIALDLARREALPLEVLISLVAQCVERRCAVLSNHLPGLAVEVDILLFCLSHTPASLFTIFSVSLFLDPVIAALLDFLGELRAFGLDDAAIVEHVYDVGLDHVEQTLVVCDDDDGLLRGEELVHTISDDAHSVDVKTGVGLVEDAQLRVEHCHLEDLVALLLTTRETFVDRAARELGIELHDLALLAHEFHEVSSGQRLQALILALSVDGSLHEVDHRYAGDLHRVLEAKEKPLAGTVLRLHLQQVLAVEDGFTLRDGIKRIAGKHSGQRGLTRPVRSHDSVYLAVVDSEVDTF